MATNIVVSRKNYPRLIQTYTILTIVVAIAAIVYGYFQFQKFTATQAALEDGRSRVTELTSTISQTSEQYTALKNDHQTTFADVRESIEAVFPSEERYTELTKALDKFILDSSNVSPMFMSNLRFNASRLDEESGYSVLPFSLTLSTTNENLERFLQYVENSGALDAGVRLMDVQSISISFPQSAVGFLAPEAALRTVEDALNVSFSMNSYYQPPTAQ